MAEIARDPCPPPRRRETPVTDGLVRPVAYVAGAILIAMILIRGHA